MTKITLYCDGINCYNKTTVEVTGWSGNGDVEEQRIFCSDCESQSKWFTAVCPGCIGSYPDCGFAHNLGKLSKSDTEKIKSGFCPFRVNGTLGFNNYSVTHINLSERANKESSLAIIKAIKNK